MRSQSGKSRSVTPQSRPTSSHAPVTPQSHTQSRLLFSRTTAPERKRRCAVQMSARKTSAAQPDHCHAPLNRSQWPMPLGRGGAPSATRSNRQGQTEGAEILCTRHTSDYLRFWGQLSFVQITWAGIGAPLVKENGAVLHPVRRARAVHTHTELV